KEQLLANIDDNWLEYLDDGLDDVIEHLNATNDIITPPPHKVFEFARLTLVSNIKCVIIGQDPYPKKDNACGLAFSCQHGIPESLKNIHKCLIYNKLAADVKLKTADLTPWAKQGVLLINASLTTAIGRANAHVAIWQRYTNRLIEKISELNAIFILWGNFAIKKGKYIKSQILTWSHPSPLSVIKKPFTTCNNFTTVNEILKSKGISQINWDFNNNESLTEVKTNDMIENNPDDKLIDIMDLTPLTALTPLMKETETISLDVIMNLKLTDRSTVIFTDGSAYPNKACKESKAAYAAVFAAGVFMDVILYGSIDNTKHYATNQRAEGAAIYKTMLYLSTKMNEWDNAIIIT
ncbi:uracil-DNA glycosylase, partial [bacterium]|nr:uracil-DNA glycosylase [bacterium]